MYSWVDSKRTRTVHWKKRELTGKTFKKNNFQMRLLLYFHNNIRFLFKISQSKLFGSIVLAFRFCTHMILGKKTLFGPSSWSKICLPKISSLYFNYCSPLLDAPKLYRIKITKSFSKTDLRQQRQTKSVWTLYRRDTKAVSFSSATPSIIV